MWVWIIMLNLTKLSTQIGHLQPLTSYYKGNSGLRNLEGNIKTDKRG